jgi:hypothetical protein
MGQNLGIVYQQAAVDHLIETHYKKEDRSFRFCHPRDLLLQVLHYCKYHNRPPEMTAEHFDRAIENYFAVM